MTSRLLVLIALVAGCESVTVLELVVLPSPGVMTVRMYSSTSAGQFEAIGPERLGPLGLNEWWALDARADLDVRDATAGDVVFQLMPGDNGVNKLSRAIFVGFDSSGAPHAFARLDQVPLVAGEVSRHMVELTTIDPQTTLVHTWPQDKDTCVAYGPRETPLQTEMLVTAADRDCDGLEQDRCMENLFMATFTSPLNQVSCVTPQPVTQQGVATNACVLGGPTCMDATGYDFGCHATPYCVPQGVCTKCQQSLACVRNLLSSFTDYASLPTYIECTVGFDISTNALCAADVLKVDLGGYLREGETKCTGDIKISHEMAFGPSVQIPSNIAGGAPMTVTVSQLDEGCTFDVQAAGSVIYPGNLPAGSAVVAGMLDNKRGFAIPLVVIGENRGCGAQDCTLKFPNPADLMSECLYAPILSPR